mgnify:CR=1 FL=1
MANVYYANVCHGNIHQQSLDCDSTASSVGMGDTLKAPVGQVELERTARRDQPQGRRVQRPAQGLVEGGRVMSKLSSGATGEWEVVIGLEVHAQVTSNSKLFSGAATEFGAEPNTQACAVDLALPGGVPGQRLQLRAEEERAPLPAVVERLLAERG